MVGLGYRVLEGPEVEIDYYNFTALNHPPGHPRGWSRTPSTSRPGRISKAALDAAAHAADGAAAERRRHARRGAGDAAHPHLADAGPRDGGPGAADLRRSSPARSTAATRSTRPTRRCSTRSRGSRWPRTSRSPTSQGTLREMLRGVFGEGREARMRPHFFPFTEPSVEFDVSCFACDGSGALPDGSRCALCKGVGWIEVGGAGMVDPNVFGFVRDDGYDPERVQGFAFGVGIERIAMLRHGVPDLRWFFETTCACWSSSHEGFGMRVPLEWLREYCDPGWDPEELAERLAMTGTEVERVGRVGAPSAEGFVLGPGQGREQAPGRRPPQRLRGRHRRRRADDRLRRAQRRGRPARPGGPARRGASRRHQAEEGEAARRRVRRDDPVRDRAGDRRGLRRDHRAGRGRRAERREARRRAGGGGAALAGGAGAGGDHQPLGLPRGLRRRARGPRHHGRGARGPALGRRTPRRRARGGRRTTPRSRSRFPSSARASPPGSSPTSRSGPRRCG